MKKVLFTLFTALSFTVLQAQGDFKIGVTGGLLNSDVDVSLSALGLVDLGNIDAIANTGFYVGAIADIGVSDKFHVQPELTYGSAGDLAYVYLPVMAKYYIVSKLNVQVGPQFSFSTNADDIKGVIQDINGVLGSDNNIDDVIKSMGVDLGFGVGFDILDNLSAQARYAVELTNRYDGPLNNSLEVKAATLNIGIAYFF